MGSHVHAVTSSKANEFHDFLLLSTYLPPTLYKLRNRLLALEEAKEIDLYLHTLEKYFLKLELADFTECQVLFRPLFHVICMIWRDSKYYCSSSKLMVLLKQINNLLIFTVCKFVYHNIKVTRNTITMLTTLVF